MLHRHTNLQTHQPHHVPKTECGDGALAARGEHDELQRQRAHHTSEAKVLPVQQDWQGTRIKQTHGHRSCLHIDQTPHSCLSTKLPPPPFYRTWQLQPDVGVDLKPHRHMMMMMSSSTRFSCNNRQRLYPILFLAAANSNLENETFAASGVSAQCSVTGRS